MVRDRPSCRLRTTMTDSCRPGEDNEQTNHNLTYQHMDKETCTCNVFAQCEYHLEAINTCTDLQQTINDEMKRQAKFDRVVSHKMVAKSRRLLLRAENLHQMEGFEWLVNGLKDLSQRMGSQADEHCAYMTTLTNHHYSIQNAIDGHQNLMSRVQLSGDVSIDQMTESDTCEPNLTSDDHEKHDFKCLSFREACTKFEQIRKNRMAFINKLEYIKAQDNTTNDQLREVRSTLSVMKKADQDSRQWAIQLKIKDQESRARFLQTHKEQLAYNLRISENELQKFDKDNQMTLLLLLNVFTQHHNSHDNCLKRGFQLLKAVSLRDKDSLGSLFSIKKQEKEGISGHCQCFDDNNSTRQNQSPPNMNFNRNTFEYSGSHAVGGLGTRSEGDTFHHEVRISPCTEKEGKCEIHYNHNSNDAENEESSFTCVTREVSTVTKSALGKAQEYWKSRKSHDSYHEKDGNDDTDTVSGSSECRTQSDSSFCKSKRHVPQADMVGTATERKVASPSSSGYENTASVHTSSSSQINSSASIDTFVMYGPEKKINLVCPVGGSVWQGAVVNNCTGSGDGPLKLKDLSLPSERNASLCGNVSETDSAKTRRFISKYIDNNNACGYNLQGALSTSIQSSLVKREPFPRYQCGKWEDKKGQQHESGMTLQEGVTCENNGGFVAASYDKWLLSQTDFQHLSKNYNNSEFNSPDNDHFSAYGDTLEFEQNNRTRRQNQNRNIQVCTVRPIKSAENPDESETKTKTSCCSSSLTVPSNKSASEQVSQGNGLRYDKCNIHGELIVPLTNYESEYLMSVNRQNDNSTFIKERSKLSNESTNCNEERIDTYNQNKKEYVNDDNNEASQKNKNHNDVKCTRTIKKVRFSDSVDLELNKRQSQISPMVHDRPISRQLWSDVDQTFDSNKNQSNNTPSLSENRRLNKDIRTLDIREPKFYRIPIYKSFRYSFMPKSVFCQSTLEQQQLFNNNIVSLFNDKNIVKLVFNITLHLSKEKSCQVRACKY